MKLDPKVKALLTAIAAAADPSIDSIPLDVAREQVEKGYARMRIPVLPVGSIQDISFLGTGGEIVVRIYIVVGYFNITNITCQSNTNIMTSNRYVTLC
jgi:hypothetical protein